MAVAKTAWKCRGQDNDDEELLSPLPRDQDDSQDAELNHVAADAGRSAELHHVVADAGQDAELNHVVADAGRAAELNHEHGDQPMMISQQPLVERGDQQHPMTTTQPEPVVERGDQQHQMTTQPA